MHGTRPSDEFLAISRHENPRHPRAGGASPGIIHSAEQVKIRTGSGRHTAEVQIPEPDDIRAILTTLNLFAEADPLWRRWRGFMQMAIHTGMRMSELRAPGISRAGVRTRT